MDKMKKIAAVLLMMGLLACVACGRGGADSSDESKVKQESTAESEQSQEDSKNGMESTEDSEESGLAEGMTYSVYTGLPIREETARTQPLALVLNNIRQARPQSGIEGADIIYETEAEGGITRLVAIFQDYQELEKIGSIRSARRAFLDFALDQGAVLVHYGEDKAIKNVYNESGCPHMNGLSYLDGKMTWRSTDRKAPHNVYTSGERLQTALELCHLEKEINPPERRVFTFAQEWQVPEGGQAVQKVSLPIYKSEFVYNPATRAYDRYQNGEVYVDLETGNTVGFTNVLIQKTSIELGEDGLHMNIRTIGSGQGYYLTGGKMFEVTWEKKSQDEETRWYGADGQELILNPGTTWINVIRSGATVKFE